MPIKREIRGYIICNGRIEPEWSSTERRTLDGAVDDVVVDLAAVTWPPFRRCPVPGPRWMMRVTLVHNPGAGDESHSAKRILKRLTDAGHDANLGSTGKRGISKALEDPGDLVVAAGGDGTIKKVALALAGRGIPLAILPIGTANNIAKSLGIIGSVDELIAGWRSGNRRRLAVGTVAASYGTMRFVESVGVGAFTDLVGKGVEFSHRPKMVSRGDEMELWKATFRDPDGHGIALTEWRPRTP